MPGWLAARHPFFPVLSGLPLYSQVLSADPGKPAFPLVFTEGCEVVIPKFTEAVSRIYSYNKDTATTGLLIASQGLITRFTYK